MTLLNTIDVLAEARHMEDYLIPSFAPGEWDRDGLQALASGLDLNRLRALVDELLSLDSFASRRTAPAELRGGFVLDREPDAAVVEELAGQVALLKRAAAKFFRRDARERFKVIVAEVPVFREAINPRIEDEASYTSLSMPDTVPQVPSAAADVPLIAAFHGLHVLVLSGNALTTLPVDFSQLDSLRAVDLAGNRFATIPEPLLGVGTLEWLDLSGSPITQLPEDLGALRGLRYLGLRSARLSPADVERLRMALPDCTIEA